MQYRPSSGEKFYTVHGYQPDNNPGLKIESIDKFFSSLEEARKAYKDAGSPGKGAWITENYIGFDDPVAMTIKTIDLF